MTIVAQGSVLDLSEAETLLRQMESVLLATLKEDGENIIRTSTTNNRTGQKLPIRDFASSAQPGNKFDDCPFSWTKEALQMRIEISSLANVEEIDINQNSSIFELGLDSIDMIKLSSRLKKHGILISVGTIIKSQSIAKMASNIHVDSGVAADVDYSFRYVKELNQDLSRYLMHRQLIPAESETVLPATPLQQTMVNEMIKSNFSRYFTFEVFKLAKATENSRLITAIQAVMDKSPILRTCFIAVDDPKSPVSYAQVVLKSREHVTESVESDLESFLVNFRAKSTALAASNSSLFHVQVITAGGASYMIWAISHALYDGTSLRLLHQDIEQAYGGKQVSRPDYLHFLEHILKSTTEEAKSFWKATLSNLPQATFPKKDSSLVYDSTVVHRLEAPSRVSLDAVEKLCRSSKVTLQTLGQTCWAVLLAHLMGQLDVVFGTVLSCRDSEESNEIMFPLMNTVAVRSVLHGTLVDMLKYMQNISDRTRQYQHFPLGTVQALALSSQNVTPHVGTALFDTLFIYQGRRTRSQGKQLYESVLGASDVEFPVCIEMEIIDGRLEWTAACKSSSRDGIETGNMIEMLDTVLQRIISTPEAPTVVSDAADISICGLPKFQMAEATAKISPGPTLKTSEGDWTNTELVIRKALHDVSGVSEDLIHKDSTIFQLGLDSIVILKIPVLLKVHGIKLSVSDILKDQTIFSMASTALHQKSRQTMPVDIDATLSNAVSSLDSSTAQSLERQIGDIQYVLPATAGQLYMIRMWQSSHGILFYPSFTYSIDGSVDKARLEGAWAALLNHHDILRTGFLETESGILQIIFKGPTSQLVHYFTGSQSKCQESCPETTVHGLRRPPLRLVVEEPDDSSPKLKLVIHHALYDGISLPVLMQQLQLLYQGQSLPPALSFKLFVAKSINAHSRISEVASNSTLTRAQWTSYLSPTSHAIRSDSDTSHVGSDERTEVFRPMNQVSLLRQRAQDAGVSVDALLLASVSKVYARRLSKLHSTSVLDVVFGVYLANRAPFGEDLSKLAAPTLNILPLCVHDPIGRRIEDIVVDVQEDLRKISSEEMSCASLKDVYEWTGVCVNFIVNILKDVNSEAATSDESMFKPVQDMTRKADVVEHSPQDALLPMNKKCDAYLVSPDLQFLLHIFVNNV